MWSPSLQLNVVEKEFIAALRTSLYGHLAINRHLRHLDDTVATFYRRFYVRRLIKRRRFRQVIINELLNLFIVENVKFIFVKCFIIGQNVGETGQV